jgi:hypothetical protein
MQKNINLNTATFVGIDCHPTEHTALAMNRFEDEKGILRFQNSQEGISQFLSWLPTMGKIKQIGQKFHDTGDYTPPFQANRQFRLS